MINASIIALSMLLGPGDEIVVVIDDIPTVEVSYVGLDLMNSADRRTLDGRIRRAARHVCSVHYLPAITWHERVDCQQDSLANAMTKLDRVLERQARREGPAIATIAVAASMASAR